MRLHFVVYRCCRFGCVLLDVVLSPVDLPNDSAMTSSKQRILESRERPKQAPDRNDDQDNSSVNSS